MKLVLNPGTLTQETPNSRVLCSLSPKLWIGKISCPLRNFASGTSGKELPANAGDIRDVGSIFGSRRLPGEGHGNPLQYSCQGDPMDRGAWQATVHGVSWTQLRDYTITTKWAINPSLKKEVLFKGKQTKMKEKQILNRRFWIENYWNKSLTQDCQREKRQRKKERR